MYLLGVIYLIKLLNVIHLCFIPNSLFMTGNVHLQIYITNLSLFMVN